MPHSYIHQAYTSYTGISSCMKISLNIRNDQNHIYTIYLYFITYKKGPTEIVDKNRISLLWIKLGLLFMKHLDLSSSATKTPNHLLTLYEKKISSRNKWMINHDHKKNKLHEHVINSLCACVHSVILQGQDNCIHIHVHI